MAAVKFAGGRAPVRAAAGSSLLRGDVAGLRSPAGSQQRVPVPSSSALPGVGIIRLLHGGFPLARCFRVGLTPYPQVFKLSFEICLSLYYWKALVLFLLLCEALSFILHLHARKRGTGKLQHLFAFYLFS